MLPDATLLELAAMDGARSLNVRAFIDGATGKLTKFNQRCNLMVDSRSGEKCWC